MHVVHLFPPDMVASLLVAIDFGLVGSNFSGAAFEMRYFRSQLTPSGQAARLVSLQSEINEKWLLDAAVHFFALLRSNSIAGQGFSREIASLLVSKIRLD